MIYTLELGSLALSHSLVLKHRLHLNDRLYLAIIEGEMGTFLLARFGEVMREFDLVHSTSIVSP